MKKRPFMSSLARLKDYHLYIILIVVGLVSRLPFLGVHDLVAYDGTSYLNMAKGILTGGKLHGMFPLGYPFFVAIFHIFIKDLVFAAQTVSILSGLGSIIVLYHLARGFIGRETAFICALAFSLNPLLIRLSLMTLSESLYVFWLLTGLLLFTRKKHFLFGIAMGIAAATRPEAIGILVLLTLLKLRRPKTLLFVLTGFLIIYLPNLAMLSKEKGSLVIMPKSQLLGVSAESWKNRELYVDLESKDAATNEPTAGEMIEDYALRLPREIALLAKNMSPLLFLLALFGIYKKRSVILIAPLIPFLVYPFTTPRTEDRFVLPYMATLMIFAFIAIESHVNKRWRALAYAAVFVSILAMPIINRSQLLAPETRGYLGSKTAGVFLRDKIHPGIKIADRKPFFAFYANGVYTEIPVADYEKTLTILSDRNIDLLSLQRQTVETFRRALRPLLYDYYTILGELRYEQIYFLKSGDQVVYRRVLENDPLSWRPVLAMPGAAYDPCWPPDGKSIVFRSSNDTEKGAILIASPDQPEPRILAKNTLINDPLSWAGDGKHISFAASRNGNADIYMVNIVTGEQTRVTSHAAMDRSPAFTGHDNQIIFSSDRSGRDEIYIKNIDSGQIVQLTNDGGNILPSVAPNGQRIAWVKSGTGVYISDQKSGKVIRANGPFKIAHKPAWSYDGRYIAVAAKDWGNMDIYLLKSDGSAALRLTKTAWNEMTPNWDKTYITIASDREEKTSIWALEKLQPYLDRLERPVTIHTYDFPNQ
jgi:WD40 repeat protein